MTSPNDMWGPSFAGPLISFAAVLFSPARRCRGDVVQEHGYRRGTRVLLHAGFHGLHGDAPVVKPELLLGQDARTRGSNSQERCMVLLFRASVSENSVPCTSG